MLSSDSEDAFDTREKSGAKRAPKRKASVRRPLHLSESLVVAEKRKRSRTARFIED